MHVPLALPRVLDPLPSVTALPLTDGHLGLLLLALIVVAIILGFPTAFTLMGLLAFPAMLEAGSGSRRVPVP